MPIFRDRKAQRMGRAGTWEKPGMLLWRKVATGEPTLQDTQYPGIGGSRADPQENLWVCASPAVDGAESSTGHQRLHSPELQGAKSSREKSTRKVRPQHQHLRKGLHEVWLPTRG